MINYVKRRANNIRDVQQMKENNIDKDIIKRQLDKRQGIENKRIRKSDKDAVNLLAGKKTFTDFFSGSSFGDDELEDMH